MFKPWTCRFIKVCGVKPQHSGSPRVQGDPMCLVNPSKQFQRHQFPAVRCPCVGSRAWGAKVPADLSLALLWHPTQTFWTAFPKICLRDAQSNKSHGRSALKSERTRAQASPGVKDSPMDVLESMKGMSLWGCRDLHFVMTHSLGSDGNRAAEVSC